MSRVEKFSKLNKRGGRGWNMIPEINKRASPFIRKLRVQGTPSPKFQNSLLFLLKYISYYGFLNFKHMTSIPSPPPENWEEIWTN